jgi:hypothetical protein
MVGLKNTSPFILPARKNQTKEKWSKFKDGFYKKV